MVGPDGSGVVAIISRPFALIGRSAAADLPVPSQEASLRHLYLHLDHRGVFAVDLISRTGTWFEGAPAGTRSGWLRPGDALVIAGYRIELIEAVPSPRGQDNGPPETSLLDERADLPPVELCPEGGAARPLSLLSELSFLGRSRACAVRAEGDNVARVHAVVVRSVAGIFLVNLAGPGLSINGAPAAMFSPIRHGDRLELGRSRFTVRLSSASRAAIQLPPTSLGRAVSRPDESLPSLTDEPGSADLAQVLLAVRDGQERLIRTNDQFQGALIAVVRQLYQEQSTLFERHLDRLDRLQHEVGELRSELRERLESPPPSPKTSGALSPPPAPMNLPDPSRSPDSGRATSWLIDRLGELEDQVEQESRSTWRDLLSRFGPPQNRDDG